MNSLGFHQNKNAAISVIRQKVQAVDMQYFSPEIKNKNTQSFVSHHENVTAFSDHLSQKLRDIKHRRPRLVMQ